MRTSRRWKRPGAACASWSAASRTAHAEDQGAGHQQARAGRTLRKFRGTAWDQSPIFQQIYEEEYGQFGGEPFGVLIGDYAFDHSPEDVQLLADMAQIAAAAHAPFIAAAAPA